MVNYHRKDFFLFEKNIEVWFDLSRFIFEEEEEEETGSTRLPHSLRQKIFFFFLFLFSRRCFSHSLFSSDIDKISSQCVWKENLNNKKENAHINEYWFADLSCFCFDYWHIGQWNYFICLWKSLEFSEINVNYFHIDSRLCRFMDVFNRCSNHCHYGISRFRSSNVTLSFLFVFKNFNYHFVIDYVFYRHWSFSQYRFATLSFAQSSSCQST